MKTAMFEFKCRRCGVISLGGITGVKAAKIFLEEVLSTGSSRCNNSIPLFEKQPHICADDGIVVADMIGFKVCDE